jgi:hypothetical protein
LEPHCKGHGNLRAKTGQREFRRIQRILDTLSPRSRIALYVLLVDAKLSYRHLGAFLLNPAYEGQTERLNHPWLAKAKSLCAGVHMCCAY